MLPSDKEGGPAWATVARRVKINADTGNIIQDLTIDHAADDSRPLHARLPGGTTNTTTVLYHNNLALVEDEPQHSGTDEDSAHDD